MNYIKAENTRKEEITDKFTRKKGRREGWWAEGDCTITKMYENVI